MKLKESVTKQDVKPPIWYACGIVEMIYRANNLQFVVTSMTDSHDDRPKSLHLKGLAVDIRTRDIPPGLLDQVFKSVQAVLNPKGFDVAPEGDHLHVEYDPKPNEDWMTRTA